MKNIILMAPIAAGKGTQGEILKNEYGYVPISTGAIFREIIATGSPLGKQVKDIIDSGKLIDDDLTIKIVKEKLLEVGDKPFILDGFPRTLNQAKIINKFMEEKSLDYQVIYLDLSLDTSMKRTLGRLICECGKSYNIYYDELKAKNEGICDSCGKTLYKRDEDNEETFKLRYNNLMNNLKPVLDLYQSIGKLNIVNAEQSVDEIHQEIMKVLK